MSIRKIKGSLAPRARFELATLRLTAECSTIELPGNCFVVGQFSISYDSGGCCANDDFACSARRAAAPAIRECKFGAHNDSVGGRLGSGAEQQAPASVSSLNKIRSPNYTS